MNRLVALGMAALPCLSFGSPVSTFREPTGMESRATASVVSVDAKRRSVTLDVHSLRTAEGKDHVFGKPRRQTVTVPWRSHVHLPDDPASWLQLTDAKPGDQVEAFVIGGKDPSDWVVPQLVLSSQRTLPVPFVVPTGPGVVDYDQICLDPVTVPMTFPVLGRVRWDDSFLASRGGGTRRHKGQDLMAPKMTPMVACFPGRIFFGVERGNAGNTITIEGDNGWTAQYYHVNNDTPGTDDGKGTERYAFAPGLQNGDRVVPGQLVGWLGDSGNAEGTAPHLHFELWWRDTKVCYNATPSLRAAKPINALVARVPVPDWAPGKGEIRIDGIIGHVDAARNVVVVEQTAVTSGAKRDVLEQPSRRYIRLTDAKNLNIWGGTTPVDIGSLYVGQRITALTTTAKEGQAVELRNGIVFPLAQSPWLGFSSLFAVSPFADGQPAVTASISVSESFLQSLGERVGGLLNARRAELRIANLTPLTILGRAAQTHATAMMNDDFFGPTHPLNKLSASDIARADGHLGETVTVVSSARTADDLVSELVAKHPQIVMSSTFRSVGVGHVYIDLDPGKVQHQSYWCLVFGK